MSFSVPNPRCLRLSVFQHLSSIMSIPSEKSTIKIEKNHWNSLKMRTNAVFNDRSPSIVRFAKHVIFNLCKPVAICLIVSHSSVIYVASSTSRKGLKRSKWVEWLNVYTAFQDIMTTYPADFYLSREQYTCCKQATFSTACYRNESHWIKNQ